MNRSLRKAREAPSSTKARILAAAEEVFAIKGFAATAHYDTAIYDFLKKQAE